MSDIAKLIKEFCEANADKYSFYGGYSGRWMFGRKCVGIVVDCHYSYMVMMMELTKFLDANDFDDIDLKMEGTAVDDMGKDTIVYFPNIEG